MRDNGQTKTSGTLRDAAEALIALDQIEVTYRQAVAEWYRLRREMSPAEVEAVETLAGRLVPANAKTHAILDAMEEVARDEREKTLARCATLAQGAGMPGLATAIRGLDRTV